jgi:KRAB domain-containing zinc finger protein
LIFQAFKTSVQLAGHKNTHTKPFSCSVCSRAFASLYAVKLHMEVHRNDASLKYVCKICNAQYGRSFALMDHLKTAHDGMPNEETAEEHYMIEESPTVIEDNGDVYSVVMVSK